MAVALVFNHANSRIPSREPMHGRADLSIAGHFWSRFALRISNNAQGLVWAVVRVEKGS